MLVAEDEELDVAQLIFAQDLRELLRGLVHALAIVAVHNEDQPCITIVRMRKMRSNEARTLGAVAGLIVVAPQGANLVSPPDVPRDHRQRLVLNGFHLRRGAQSTQEQGQQGKAHIESDRGDRRDDLAEF